MTISTETAPPQQARATAESPPKLEDLIPIAVVIAAGCEPCAQKMVTRALEQGSSERHVKKALAIVGYLQRLDCVAEEIGPEAVARMEKPLAMGKRTLEQATA